jgi:hypothetical protein
MPVLDQERMLAIRQAWFDECGAPPPGNKLALERKAWQVCGVIEQTVQEGAVPAGRHQCSIARVSVYCQSRHV